MPSRIMSRSGMEHLVDARDRSRGSGVVIGLRTGLALAVVMVRKNRQDDLARRVHDVLGLELPVTPRCTVAGAVAFAWAGPGRWLAVAEGAAAPGFEARLEAALSDLCAISRQSNGRTVIGVAGPAARATLAKLVPIDLHPRAFGPGDTALTAAGEITVQLWQVDATPGYELVVFRSYAAALWRWLADAAAEFGGAAGD